MKNTIKIAVLTAGLLSVAEVGATNINPNMTFGDLPVVGVLIGGSYYHYNPATTDWSDMPVPASMVLVKPAYAAGRASGSAASQHVNPSSKHTTFKGGWACPAGTATIEVNGFNFTQYNGWNGVYKGYKVSHLCVVPST